MYDVAAGLYLIIVTINEEKGVVSGTLRPTDRQGKERGRQQENKRERERERERVKDGSTI